MLFDPLLCLANGTVQERMFEFLVLLQAHLLHVFDNAIGAEQPHEIVFERDTEMRGARIALAGATATQFAIDATRLVPLSAHHVKSADVRHAVAELHDSTAASH